MSSSTPIFMRGEPCDLTATFYLGSIINATKGYVFIQNTQNASTGGVTPVGGFINVTSMYNDYPLIEFGIVSYGNNFYTFTVINEELSNYCLGIDSSGNFDLVEIPSTGTPWIILNPPTGTNLNIYNMGTLYPSLNYELQSGNLPPQSMYVFNISSSNSWEYYTIIPTKIPIMLIPVNTGQLTVWQDSACYYSTVDNVGIEWFYNWLTGQSVGCDSGSSLSSTSNNCYFSSANGCANGYLYSYCTANSTCGNCMGITNVPKSYCFYNTVGSSAPLFISTASAPETTVDIIEIEPPPTTTTGGCKCCNNSGNCSNGAIIFLVILFIIIISLIIWSISSSKKKKSVKNDKSKTVKSDSNNSIDSIDSFDNKSVNSIPDL